MPDSPQLDIVTLKGMRFHTQIGVLPHEAEIAQSIEVDLSVWVPARKTGAGSAGILDYRELYEIVASVLGGGHMRYLEDVGEKVASNALRLDSVVRARVVVRKPHVVMPGPLDYAEVTVDRSRA